ncbi:MAG: hypothetical protein ACTSWY_12685 [Promethearchaeota archaeon]
MSHPSKGKFKTFKYDAAPFFFYIDIFPPDLTDLKQPTSNSLVDFISSNPILPLPMRVDRVFNGEESVLIRPREPVSFPITVSGKDFIAIIDPIQFLQEGLKKLLFFTEIRASELFIHSLTPPKIRYRIQHWWNLARNSYSFLYRLEEDFTAFLRSYILTMVKTKMDGGDLVTAAKKYCQMIYDICDKRMNQNIIRTDIKGKQEEAKFYKKKTISFYKHWKKVEEVQYHPELVDIEIFDLSERGFTRGKDEERSLLIDEIEKPKRIKYIPLLFYDDLMECMLQNMERLKEGDENFLDPSYLLDKKIIVMKEKSMENGKQDTGKYSWWQNFDEIELEPIMDSIGAVNKKSLEIHRELSLIRNIMDSQKFSEAQKRLIALLSDVKKSNHLNFVFMIENLKKACEMNSEFIERNLSCEELVKKGEKQKAHDNLLELLNKFEDPEIKDYVDGVVHTWVLRCFRLAGGDIEELPLNDESD